MSENSENRNVRNDEIDLLDLFSRMGKTFNRWGKALWKAFLISIVFIVKRWLPLGISIIIGFGVSYFFKSSSTTTYTADMVLKGNSITSPEMFRYFNRLQNIISSKNSDELARLLSLDSETSKNIVSLNADWIIDYDRDSIPDYINYSSNQDVNDTSNLKIRMQDRLNIRLSLRSSQELNSVSKGIVSFFEKDSLLQQRNRLRIRQNRDMLARLDKDIAQLDSLQKIKYFEESRSKESGKSGQMIFLQEQKTQLVYSDIYSLYKKKQLLETEQDLYKGVVTVLNDFSIPSPKTSTSMSYARPIIPIFFFIALLILIIIENRKKLKEVYKKYE